MKHCTLVDYLIPTNRIIDILDYYDEEISDCFSDVNYYVGTNAEDNWNLYRASSQSFTIFHLDKFSSPYVVIDQEIDNLNQKHLNLASLICKYYSKYKNVPNINIMYTPISNTSLGDTIGSFIVKNNKKKKVYHYA